MPTTTERRTLLQRRRTSVKKVEMGNSGEYEIELLEYEWPDLPPISRMKDAISRRRVSSGISYLLPVDKSKNSINSHFRTDLRAMFQEPYASDDFGYDDNRVKLSAKIHFASNTADTKWTKGHLRTLPVELNSDSEQVRTLYTRSAPSNGSANKCMGIDPCKMRKRSNLYLPIKAKIPPEAIKIRNEVDKIIRSVQENDGDYVEEEHVDNVEENEDITRDKKKTVSSNESTTANVSSSRLQRQSDSPYGKQHFKTYDELRSAHPPKIVIPDEFKSAFVNEAKNQEIWDWLHEGDELNDFQYFLSVCG